MPLIRPLLFALATSTLLHAAPSIAAETAPTQTPPAKMSESTATPTKTASGLQYIVLKQGTGPKPVAADKVKVHYVGTLTDGTKFDSSYDRGEPATFPLGAVIRGWTEGLQLMPVGSKYKFIIPPDLAYGKAGAAGVIPPDATLIFEVELLSIEK